MDADERPSRLDPRRLAALLSRRPVRLVGAVAGFLLLLLALGMVVARRDTLREAWDALSSPAPELVAAVLALVVGNLLFTSLVFHVLISRFGRVGRAEMAELIAASTLLNFVPMRPGLFGRVAWHRVVNGIPAVQSARTIVESIGLSAGCVALLVGGLIAGQAVSLAAAAPTGLAATLLLPAAMALTPRLRPLSGAALWRCLDLACWGGRYWVCFRLIDAPMPMEAALAVAAASTAASLVPLAGNGLGLREWTTGLLAPLLYHVDLHQALTAELVNRAAEVIVVVPAGLASIAALTARRRRMRRHATPAGAAAEAAGQEALPATARLRDRAP